MTQPGKSSDKPRIGITLGDLNGIGPEVVIKALADNRLLASMTPILYGSTRALSFYRKMMKVEDFNFVQVKTRGQYSARNINVINCWEDMVDINPGQPSQATGKAALKAIQQASADLKEGLIDALVTAPIDKHSIQSDEFPFKGHTDFLANYFGAKESTMCLVSDKLRVALATEHVAFKEVPSLLTRELIYSKVMTVERFLQQYFQINKPKIALLGLNPHAGEEGLLGSEEEQVLKPVIQDLKNKGKLVSGPFPADGFFGSFLFKKYDAVLAMYHDQGLIPIKTLAFDSAVNITAGLPIIRTSPDHGTAYPIAGKNIANENSMREAIYLACDILRRANEPSKEKLT